MATEQVSTIPAPGNNLIREYINRDGEPVTLAETETILAEIEDIAMGIGMFCTERTSDFRVLSPEESASLRFINAGVKRILAGLCRTMPEVETEGAA